MRTRDSIVTIGLSVRNEGATIGDTITSLLAQTHADFELIVSDNGRAILAHPGDNCRACGVFRRCELAASVADRACPVAWDWLNMIALARRGRFVTLDRLHVVRGTDGDSRHPDYRSAFLFLARSRARCSGSWARWVSCACSTW